MHKIARQCLRTATWVTKLKEIHTTKKSEGRDKADGELGQVLLLDWGSGYSNVSFVIVP